MAKRQSRQAVRDPAAVFGQLVPAVQVLDSWLVWMETACCRIIGSGGAGSLPFLHRPPSLPIPGMSFGEEGDDGTLVDACRFLRSVVEAIRVEIEPWRAAFTRPRTIPFAEELFQYERVPDGPPAPYAVSECCSAHAFPSAHEAAYEWLRRFCRLAGEAIPSLLEENPADPIIERAEMTLFFRGLRWNAGYAAILLAGMEQERRWLHQQHGTILDVNGLPSREYEECWRSNQTPLFILTDILREMPQLARLILEALRRLRPQKKGPLVVSTIGSRLRASGAFNNALNLLLSLGLIKSTGRGRATRGYDLTVLGIVAAQRLNTPRSDIQRRFELTRTE